MNYKLIVFSIVILFLWKPLKIQADILQTWTTNLVVGGAGNYYAMDCIVYGNNRYVAAAEGGDFEQIFSSEDGLNWTVRYSGGGPWGLSLNYVNGLFIGVGGYGSIVISTNGTDWTVSNLSFNDNGNFGDATYANGLFVKVGNTNGIGAIFTSPDGNNWTSQRLFPSSGSYIPTIACNSTLFVAIGNNDGFEYTSLNGISWTRRSMPGGNVISYANGLFIVPFNAGTNLISNDGINWTQQSTGLTNMLGRIIFANGVFMTRAAYSYLATSIDGTNWFQYPSLIPFTGSFQFSPTGFAPYYAGAYSDFATDGSHLVVIANVGGNNSGYLPFPGVIYNPNTLVDIRMTNDSSKSVVLSGLVGRNYQIQSLDTLTSSINNWHTNLTLQLSNTPIVWTDLTATNSTRFYRGAILP